jgi:hypothetical protein
LVVQVELEVRVVQVEQKDLRELLEQVALLVQEVLQQLSLHMLEGLLVATLELSDIQIQRML